MFGASGAKMVNQHRLEKREGSGQDLAWDFDGCETRGQHMLDPPIKRIVYLHDPQWEVKSCTQFQRSKGTGAPAVLVKPSGELDRFVQLTGVE